MLPSIQELKTRFPHPLNSEILKTPLGGHPNYEDLLTSLSRTLLRDMTDGADIPMKGSVLKTFPANDPRLLAHKDIVFAAHISMSIVLRLPEASYIEALTSGAKQTQQEWKLDQEWIDITWMQDDERKRLIQIAYEYANELSKIPLSVMTIILCPNCEQKLRVPSNRGELSIRCPKCRQDWLRSSELRG